jgi:hypothetical protein
MTDTTNLGLPFIEAAQSQKHVTHNEALRLLDLLIALSVVERATASPPASPAEGARYLIGPAPTGAFAGRAGQIAGRQDGGWLFLAPRAGWLAHVVSEGVFLAYDGSGWNDVKLAPAAFQNLSALGIGTSSDAGNPLSAKLNAALLTARATAEGGSGDLRLTLNKSAPTTTVSQIYSDNYSARAETGLIGDDRWRVKVSADGVAWKSAIEIDPASGIAAFPAADGLTATAGGGAAAALALSNAVNRFTTVASAGDSAALPAASPGRICVVINSGAAALQIFGSGTDTINNAPVASGWTLASGRTAIFACGSSGKWHGGALT